MKYLSIRQPYEIIVGEGSFPSFRPEEGEVLLKMLYGGICGSDLSTYRGIMAYASYPRIPGHEFSAEIVEIGPNERGLKPGMVVTANPYFNCGHCYSCRRGLVNCCETNETMGVQRDGSFREYFTMPADRLFDGEGIPPRQLALIEPFSIGYHGVKRADVKSGDKVLVVGAGTIGVLAAVSALLMGGEVYLSDIDPAKLEYVNTNFDFAGTLLNDSSEHFQEQVRSITNHNGFDVTVEAVGQPSTFQNCVDAAAYGGRVVQIGVGKKSLEFNFTVIQKKELNIFGSRNARNDDFRHLIRAVGDGKLNIERVITNVYDFTRAADAFSDFDRNTGKMMKVLLKFCDESSH
ncbi:zinc-binding alcohol dehydrogenase family protein [Caproicibacter sp.]|uniref:zinc-binding alcohol dehydrogenase family protein n=1 Tax=Caproicibacter sp. TaxID=2814884 RepID=UPI00398A403F